VANKNVSLKLSNKKEKKKKRMENQKREKDQQKNSVGSFFDTRHLKYLMLHSKTNFYRRVSIMGIEHGRHLPAFYFYFFKYQYFLFLINCKSCMFPELCAIIRIVRTDLNLARSGLYPC
jgi:UDP-N-acetylenolpyruvoylglucosamine reductase